MKESVCKKKVLLSLVIGVVFVILLNIYIFFIERLLPVNVSNAISNIYVIPYFIGALLSGNVHQPNELGFNLATFGIGFICSFLILFLTEKIKKEKGNKSEGGHEMNERKRDARR